MEDVLTFSVFAFLRTLMPSLASYLLAGWACRCSSLTGLSGVRDAVSRVDRL